MTLGVVPTDIQTGVNTPNKDIRDNGVNQSRDGDYQYFEQ